MATPIIILAGQSNARALRDSVVAALTAQYGAGGFVLVHASAAGAPLTYKRSGEDWFASDELRHDMQRATAAALEAAPDGRIEGMIWAQGESDTQDIARAGEYAGRLTQLFDGFRSAIASGFAGRDTGAETARLALSGLSDHAPKAALRDQWQTVSLAQAAVAGGDTRSALVDPDLVAEAHGIAAAAMFRDDLHYSAAMRPLLAEALVTAATGSAIRSELPPGIGTSGNDRLEGTTGADTLIGGRGDDVYVIDHSGDRIIELEGEGFDRVYSDRSFSLRFQCQFLEDLKLTGSGDIDGTGNGQDNRIVGNLGDNRLDGAWGDDILRGGAGDDWLTGHRGDDTLTGGAGRDVFVFRPGDGHDRITDFDPARDRLGLDTAIARGQVALTQQGDDLLVQLGADTSVVLEGVAQGDLLPFSLFTL